MDQDLCEDDNAVADYRLSVPDGPHGYITCVGKVDHLDWINRMPIVRGAGYLPAQMNLIQAELSGIQEGPPFTSMKS